MQLRASLLSVAVVMAAPLTASAQQPTAASDTVEAGFLAPPDSAKPRVWWHWINGNVNEEGIKLDLEWLKRVGVGGVQNFDASLPSRTSKTAAVVDKRVAYRSPAWQETFRYAVTMARSLGLEFTIASSPGWSESGGPWVKPEQAMKKLVWSETSLTGGIRYTGVLQHPPMVTGPFQDVAFSSVLSAADAKSPTYYADAAVVAYQMSASENLSRTALAAITSSSGPIDTALLSDHDLTHSVALAFGDGPTSWIQFAYPKPQSIRSLTISIGRPPNLDPSDMSTGGKTWLEAGSDAQPFRKVVDIPRNGAIEQTLSFAPVTASKFRVVFERPSAAADPLADIGLIPHSPAPTAHQILELSLSASPRINRFEDKAAFSNRAILEADDSPVIDAHDAIDKRSVIDLTAKMRPDGTLDWMPPKGEWVVLRFGYSLTGHTNHPASAEGTGLEVDKLNQGHVKSYFDQYFSIYQSTLGPELIGKQGLEYMLTDSYEAGIANWTDDILDQFRQRRGYDPRPFLPALAGHVVGSAIDSDRFLWDFRETLSDLITDAHYEQLSTLLHEHGMGRYGESHESGRVFTGDGMRVKKSADIPMGALWSSTLGQPRESFDADIRESASVAHIYGQNLVAAESMTAFGNTFAFTPETLKPYADRELAMGLNRFVIHTSVHQPDSRPGPGVTLGPFGQWFTRHETWAPFATPWISYLARSSYLLQQGHFVADVAYLYGEGNNITNLFATHAPEIPAGYNFDFVNADALVHVLSVRDGTLVTPSGMAYRVLALDPSTRRMSLPVLRAIRQLVRNGATVIGETPTLSPSLNDDQNEFQAIVKELWGREGESAAHAGHVYAGVLRDVLPSLGIVPDCTFDDASGPPLRFVHRSIPGLDIYFVSSPSDTARTVEASFRIAGKAPELWHADSGAIEMADYRMDNDRTTVPLALEPNGAVFVVFRRPTAERVRVAAATEVETVATLSGPWELRFAANLGAPPQIHLGELSSWTSSRVPGVKYFSGTGTYTTTFKAEKSWTGSGSRLQLDLGDVKNIAQVFLNGRDMGIAWKTPFRIDITDGLRPGANRLDIKVTNLWPNRIIGDKQPGAEPIAFTTFDPFKADSPLLSSGLIGPVTLRLSRYAGLGTLVNLK